LRRQRIRRICYIALMRTIDKDAWARAPIGALSAG
jgi:hypothetical protein